MKKNKIKNTAYISVSVLVLISISFLRESVFVNVNAHMWYLYFYEDKSYLEPYLSFLSPLTYSELYWLKWGMTGFFSLMFLFFYCLIIKLIFIEKKFIRWTVYSFLTIAVISAFAYLSGILFNDLATGYSISRFFMGMIQSPFLLVFLIPAFRLAVLEKGSACHNEQKTKIEHG